MSNEPLTHMNMDIDPGALLAQIRQEFPELKSPLLEKKTAEQTKIEISARLQEFAKILAPADQGAVRSPSTLETELIDAWMDLLQLTPEQKQFPAGLPEPTKNMLEYAAKGKQLQPAIIAAAESWDNPELITRLLGPLSKYYQDLLDQRLSSTRKPDSPYSSTRAELNALGSESTKLDSNKFPNTLKAVAIQQSQLRNTLSLNLTPVTDAAHHVLECDSWIRFANKQATVTGPTPPGTGV